MYTPPIYPTLPSTLCGVWWQDSLSWKSSSTNGVYGGEEMRQEGERGWSHISCIWETICGFRDQPHVRHVSCPLDYLSLEQNWSFYVFGFGSFGTDLFMFLDWSAVWSVSPDRLQCTFGVPDLDLLPDLGDDCTELDGHFHFMHFPVSLWQVNKTSK